MRKRKCKDCGDSELKLSHKGLCINCSLVRMKVCGQQIKDKKGKYYQNYKKGVLRYLGLKEKAKEMQNKRKINNG